jgi:hypothetical protein
MARILGRNGGRRAVALDGLMGGHGVILGLGSGRLEAGAEKKKGPEGPLCARPIYQRDFEVTP